jgi:cell wall-associated NlpC family hydrolase
MRRTLFLVGAVLLLIAPPAHGAPSGIARSRPEAMLTPTVGDGMGQYALRFRGTPYVWAGSTPAGFDCSGFTRWVYARYGIDLPHSSYAQWQLGRRVHRASQLRPGDLVFFGLGHVGMWLGNGRFIHSPHSGEVVSVVPLARSGYGGRFTGGVRIAGAQRLIRKQPAKDRRPARDVPRAARAAPL